MHKALYTIVATILFISLTGCNDQKLIEKLGFIHTVAYDLVEKGDKDKILVTFSLPIMEKQKGAEQEEILTTTTYSSKEARIMLSRQTNRTLVSGQLRNSLFGLDLAKKGLREPMDSILRDPSIGPRVKITIVEGKATDVLKKRFKQHPQTGQYIERMMEKEEKMNAIPRIDVYQFSRDLLDDGIDPVAPVIKLGKNEVIIDGMALFDEDRLIKKVGMKETQILLLLRDNFRMGDIAMSVSTRGSKQKENVVYTNLTNKRKITVDRASPSHIKVHINLEIKGNIAEYNGDLDLITNKNQYKLETLLAEYIRNTAKEVIQDLQKHHTDAIGIGQYIRNSMSYNEWKALNWKKIYSTLDVEVHVHVKIGSTGKFN